MNDPEIVLQAIHENAEMGRETIFHLREKADGSFAALLRQQQSAYDAILARSGDMLREMGVKPKRPSWPLRMGADMGMDMRTVRDKTPAHMSQMLINGAAMGTSDLKEELALHPDMNPKVRSLGEELIAAEQTHLNQWQQHL